MSCEKTLRNMTFWNYFFEIIIVDVIFKINKKPIRLPYESLNNVLILTNSTLTNICKYFLLTDFYHKYIHESVNNYKENYQFEITSFSLLNLNIVLP
jgi:hypothetical protein